MHRHTTGFERARVYPIVLEFMAENATNVNKPEAVFVWLWPHVTFFCSQS